MMEQSKEDQFVAEFGAQRITEDLLSSLRQVAKVERLDPLLERGVFYAHRDLPQLIKRLENNQPTYLYTGRGPSSEAMHLGHLEDV